MGGPPIPSHIESISFFQKDSICKQRQIFGHKQSLKCLFESKFTRVAGLHYSKHPIQLKILNEVGKIMILLHLFKLSSWPMRSPVAARPPPRMRPVAKGPRLIMGTGFPWAVLSKTIRTSRRKTFKEDAVK